ncbi:MAG: hypothetical protein ACPGVG_19890, partial [Mycobacterium sp.]
MQRFIHWLNTWTLVLALTLVAAGCVIAVPTTTWTPTPTPTPTEHTRHIHRNGQWQTIPANQYPTTRPPTI